MKKLLLLLLTAIIALPWAHAQKERPFSCSLRSTEDGSVEIVLRKKTPGAYTAVVYFRGLSNCSETNPVVRSLYTDEPVHIKMKPQNPGFGVSYHQLKLAHLPGPVNSRIDTLYGYHPPFKGSRELAADRMLQETGETGKVKDTEPKAYRFPMSANEDVTAVRDGIVVQTDDKPGNQPRRISIMVQHRDGTMAKYLCLAPGSVKVEEGQAVKAGQVIAQAGTDADGGCVMIELRYLTYDPKKKYDEKSGTRSVVDTKYFFPYFTTPNGKVRPLHNG